MPQANKPKTLGQFVAAAVAATTRSANNKISNKAKSKLARGANNTTRETKSEQIRTRWWGFRLQSAQQKTKKD